MAFLPNDLAISCAPLIKTKLRHQIPSFILLSAKTVEYPRGQSLDSRTINNVTDKISSHMCPNNNGNFICVFECTIVNLATYRQFTNAA